AHRLSIVARSGHAYRNSEVVQPDQGLRLYSAGRRLQGRVRPHLGGGARRPAHPARGPEGAVRAGAGTQRQEFGRGSGGSRLTDRGRRPGRVPQPLRYDRVAGPGRGSSHCSSAPASARRRLAPLSPFLRIGHPRRIMPRKPNYRFERFERERTRAAKKAARAQAKADKKKAAEGPAEPEPADEAPATPGEDPKSN